MERTTILTLCALTMLAAVLPASADVLTFNISVDGNVMTATASGSVDTTALNFDRDTFWSAGFIPGFSYLAVGLTDSTSLARYVGYTGPSSFSTSSSFTTIEPMDVAANSDTVAFFPMYERLGLPTGYVSGTSLWASTTFDVTGHASYTALGLTEGATYTWTYGTNSEHSIVLSIGPLAGGGDPVPEPATLSLLGLGLAGLVTRRPRRKA